MGKCVSCTCLVFAGRFNRVSLVSACLFVSFKRLVAVVQVIELTTWSVYDPWLHKF